jgi:hypothetical protein
MTNDEIVTFMIDILVEVEEYGECKLYTDYAGYIKPVEYNADIMTNLIAITNDKANYKAYLTEEVVTALVQQYKKIYWQVAVLTEIEVDPNDNFKGFRKNVKAFLKRNPRFYILHKIYTRGKFYRLASVTNTDDHVETSEAYIDQLICSSKCFHNNQLPIVKADTDSVNL